MEFPLTASDTSAPQGYIPYQLWQEYNYAASFPPAFKPTILNSTPRGVRWGFWPFFFEEYISDTEPNLAYQDPEAFARFVLWRRIERKDIPKGWFYISKRPSHLESLIVLDPNKEYFASWTKIARNERSRWLKLENTRYRIETISWEEFETVFRHSAVMKRIGLGYAEGFKRKHEQNPHNFVLYGVRQLETSTLIAAIGVVYSPSCNSSYYELGCMRDGTKDPVMVGLIDHWFKMSLSKNIHCLQLGDFWTPGKPKSWKGFSFFKAKFNPLFIERPHDLIRFIPGRIF